MQQKRNTSAHYCYCTMDAATRTTTTACCWCTCPAQYKRECGKLTAWGARGRKVSRRRNNETDTTSVGAHGKKREEGQKAYTCGAHGGTKKLLLAARSWRTNKTPSQPALQQNNKMSTIALHCVP
jgi:hypothetical protein